MVTLHFAVASAVVMIAMAGPVRAPHPQGPFRWAQYREAGDIDIDRTGTLVAIATREEIVVLRYADGAIIRTFRHNRECRELVVSTRFLRGTEYLASADNYGGVLIWNVRTGTQVRQMCEPCFVRVDSKGVVPPRTRADLHGLLWPSEFTGAGAVGCAVTTNGKLIAIGLKDGSVVMWNTRTGEVVHRLGGTVAGSVRHSIKSIVGKSMVSRQWWASRFGSTTADGSRIESDMRIRVLQRGPIGSMDLVFFGDDKYCASSGTGLQVWRVTDGRLLVEYPNGSGAVPTHNGKYIATYDVVDQCLVLLDWRSGRADRKRIASKCIPHAMYADNEIICSTTEKELIVVDADSGRVVRKLGVYLEGGAVRSVKVTPDQKWVLVVGTLRGYRWYRCK